MTVPLARAWHGVRWYLREFTGEARWDRYLEHCAAHGHVADEPARLRAAALRRAGAEPGHPLLLTPSPASCARSGLSSSRRPRYPHNRRAATA
ncbi:putative selenoprotein [Blastococcus sp. TML/M2B]|nr:putative selenoprotein [Blastococcus sp. TML/M2B]